MPTKTKKKAAKKPAARKAPAKKAHANSPKLCVNCAPIGHTEVLAMLLVAIFGLVAVSGVALYRLDQKDATIQMQNEVIQELTVEV